jgi:integrase
MAKLEYSEVDAENLRIYINKPEKNSRSRAITVHERTIAKIMSLPRKHEPYVFNPKVRTLESVFARSRKRLAIKAQMPNLSKIHFHSLRRFYADQLYKRSQFNTRKVQAKLGHKRLSSTEKYFNDFDSETCTYETERAETIEQAEALRQEGYELYDTFIENGKTVKLYSRLT